MSEIAQAGLLGLALAAILPLFLVAAAAGLSVWLIGAGLLFLFVAIFVLGLCRSAALGDAALEEAQRSAQQDASLGHERVGA